MPYASGRLQTRLALLQMFGIAALALLTLHYLRFGDTLETVLGTPGSAAGWVPTFWFLGVYQRLLHGEAAQPFAAAMAGRALLSTVVVSLVAIAVYPLAWTRMRRLAVEGDANRGKKRSLWGWKALVQRLVRAPEQRAVLAFIGQTVSRNSRYQVYLAMYCGTGLALAVSCGTGFVVSSTGVRPILSDFGLHAVTPLLLFWTVAGLKLTFALPLNLEARWVFRTTGVDLRQCTQGARTWAYACVVLVLLALVVVLHLVAFPARASLVQLVCGLCLGILLVDGFFFDQESVPFSRPRSPGKSSLPIMLTLYVGVLPPFLFAMAMAGQRLERKPAELLVPVALVLLLHWLLVTLRERFVLVEEESETPEGEFQLLGLSGDLRA